MAYYALAATFGPQLQGAGYSAGLSSNPSGPGGPYFAGVGDSGASTTRKIANLLFDPAGIFGGIGPGSGDDDMASEFEFGDLIALYPSVKKFDNLVKELFTEGTRGQIIDFLTKPVPLTSLEERELNFFRDELPGLVDETTGNIRGDLFPAVREVLTGRTDIDPVVAAETRRLREETAPALAARFGGAITGSGFENALNDAAEDLSFNLGALQVDLDEAFQNRLSGFLQSGAGERIFGAPLDIETGAATASGAAGERFRKRKESTRAGGRLLAAIPTLLNAATAQGFAQQGFAPSGPSGLDVLASNLPALVNAGLDLYGAFSGGGAGSLTGSTTGAAFQTGGQFSGLGTGSAFDLGTDIQLFGGNTSFGSGQSSFF